MRRWKVGLAALAACGSLGAGEQPRDVRAFVRVVLAAHNDARGAVGVPPLAWDDALAQDAQDWANYLADTGKFEHSPRPRGRDKAGEGENLWMGTAGAYAFTDMVAGWVGEQRYFRNGVMPDISSTGNWAAAGHYSQIVWRGTTRVGCGIANGRGNDYLVCRYSPPGNVIGSKAF